MTKSKSLEAYREERYLSVAEFAQLLGITAQTYYGIIRGKRPRWVTMRRVAEKLAVHPSEISEFVLRPQTDSEAEP
jgi:transcriptional regulator with XRE-family HTH domain